MTIRATPPTPEQISLERIAKATGHSAQEVESFQAKGILWSWLLSLVESANSNERGLAYYLRPVALLAGSRQFHELKANEEIQVAFTVSETRQIRKILARLGYEFRNKEE